MFVFRIKLPEKNHGGKNPSSNQKPKTERFAPSFLQKRKPKSEWETQNWNLQVQLHVLVKKFITLMRKFVACVAKKDKHWIRIHAFSNLSLCKALIRFMISFGPSNLAQD